ncbi:MAG: hypothetical protein IKT02_00295 [Bacteroidales bacterium]|nr:hypothetical protein [Bacteroidales bacterium]
MEIDLQKLIKQITGNTGIGQNIVTKVINAIKELGIFDKLSALTNNNLNLNNISNIINLKNILGTLVSKTGEQESTISKIVDSAKNILVKQAAESSVNSVIDKVKDVIPDELESKLPDAGNIIKGLSGLFGKKK